MNLQKVLKDITTTANGQTFDNIRISSLVVTLAYVALTFVSIFYLKQAFDPATFGAGAGAIFAAAGAAIGLKKGDEPGA